MCKGEVGETTAVIDTQGESVQWLASLISCPQSVYGLEQTQHTSVSGTTTQPLQAKEDGN